MNAPATRVVVMSPIVTSTPSAPGLARSCSTMCGDSSMPVTGTPRALSGSATRPVPIASSSAGPPAASSARRRPPGRAPPGRTSPPRAVVDLGDVLAPGDRSHRATLHDRPVPLASAFCDGLAAGEALPADTSGPHGSSTRASVRSIVCCRPSTTPMPCSALGAWAYVVLACAVLADGVVPLIPSELLCVAAGAFAATGRLNPWLVLPAVVAGGVLGDQATYHLGRAGSARAVRTLTATPRRRRLFDRLHRALSCSAHVDDRRRPLRARRADRRRPARRHDRPAPSGLRGGVAARRVRVDAVPRRRRLRGRPHRRQRVGLDRDRPGADGGRVDVAAVRTRRDRAEGRSDGPGDPRRHLACCARARLAAARTNARWVKACGKLPSWRSATGSYSSASRPTSLAQRRRGVRRARAPRPSRPWQHVVVGEPERARRGTRPRPAAARRRRARLR